MAIPREEVIKRMHDAIDYFALKAELEELIDLAQSVSFANEIANALKMVGEGEISRAEGFVNRANAVMN